MSPVPPPITDHVQQALDELLSQYAEAERLRRLVTVLVTQIQEAEDAGEQLLTDRLLVNAEGVNLDIYGKIVQGPAAWRGALADDDYRVMVEVAIQVNQSDGGAEQAIQILATLTGVAVEYTQHNPAHYRIAWQTASPISADLLERINEAMPRITISGASWGLVEGPLESFQFDVLGFDRGKFARRRDS